MNSSENASKIGYRDVLTQKEYMKLLVANAVNRLGDAVDSITFTWLTYALTGSASWSAVIFGLNQVPTVVIQPLAAVWVEKIDKKKVMAITDLIRGFLVMILAGAYIDSMASCGTDPVHLQCRSLPHPCRNRYSPSDH